MSEKLYSSISSNDDIVFLYISFNIVTFFSIDISLNTINLNNIKLDDNDFDNYDPETIIHVHLMGWCNRYNAAIQILMDINTTQNI